MLDKWTIPSELFNKLASTATYSVSIGFHFRIIPTSNRAYSSADNVVDFFPICLCLRCILFHFSLNSIQWWCSIIYFIPRDISFNMSDPPWKLVDDRCYTRFIRLFLCLETSTAEEVSQNSSFQLKLLKGFFSRRCLGLEKCNCSS